MSSAEGPDFSLATRAAEVLPLVRAWRLDRPFRYSIPDELSEAVAVGSLVRVPLGARKVRGVVLDFTPAGGVDGLEPIQRVLIPIPLAHAALRDLLRWVARRYVAPQPVCFERVVPPRIRAVAAPSVPRREVRAAELLPAYQGGQELLGAIASGASGSWCLRALAGSDRGRLIAELVEAAGDNVGASVVMVPEVRYGAPVLDRVEERFPGCVRLDSSRSEAERSAGWLAMAAGHGLGAGGRASALVPSPRLRLLVVDEEEHRSYKEDRAPRFDARRVALERARRQNAICVLVSTAPAVETGEAVRTGAMGLAEPSRSADRGARPIVEVFDRPADRQLAPAVHHRIRDCLRAGGKTAVLAPMRGYARSLWCGTCKRSVRCPVCEAGVRLETRGASIRCLRCGYAGAAPEVCPTCGARDFRFVGAGSERLGEQLAAMFPQARVKRVDPDTLDPGSRGETPDIYLTTWIGTKPVLRPEVSLVVVVDADSLIRLPDFRAAENAYRALAAMAEWVGPASAGGRLLVQTSDPGHHAIQAVARADYWFFLERELALRRNPVYPPFVELVKVRASGRSGTQLLDEVARAAAATGGRVLGPIEVRDASGRGAELLIKHKNAEEVAEKLRVILPKVPADTRLRVDVDPR